MSQDRRSRYDDARRRFEASGMDNSQAWQALRDMLAQRFWRLPVVRLAAAWFCLRARRLLEAAPAGDAEARYFYAQDRRKASGTDAALIRFSVAASQGYTKAMVNARMLLQGRGDLQRAYELYVAAADADDPIGAFDAGMMAEYFGYEATAQTYFQRARDLGHPHAALRLDPGFR